MMLMVFWTLIIKRIIMTTVVIVLVITVMIKNAIGESGMEMETSLQWLVLRPPTARHDPSTSILADLLILSTRMVPPPSMVTVIVMLVDEMQLVMIEILMEIRVVAEFLLLMVVPVAG